ncbi:MAG: putative lipid II flippase FtsW [Bacilli bacterium]|nr:putative lipid II flippase FtsW [Bacilli bacterium]
MKFDRILFISTILISLFGILMIYSSSSIWAEYKFNDSYHFIKYQSFFLLMGIILMIMTSRIDYHIYYKYSNLLLIGSIILLILVLIPGIGSIRNGSRSWFGIGSFGIQPSEAAKISLIIFTSKYLSRSDNQIKSFWTGLCPILLISFFIFGLIMLQPDLGTGFIILMSIFSILFISGASMRFFKIGGIFGIVGIICLIIIAPYRMDRITSFINPWKDPLGTGFQMIQSLYAIGPGGLLGLGYGNSIQKHFYLPEPQTDFIFSIISEEFGVMGSILVVSLFCIIFYRGIKISLNTNESFSKYLSFGMTFQIIFQALLNLMVVVGLIPVTGVTLPFLSYGGSSLLVSMTSIGIILNISRNNS